MTSRRDKHHRRAKGDSNPTNIDILSDNQDLPQHGEASPSLAPPHQDKQPRRSPSASYLDTATGASGYPGGTGQTFSPPVSPAPDMDTSNVSIVGMQQYFKTATEGFEGMIRKAVDSLIENIKRVEINLAESIEFESKRVSELEKKNASLEKRMSELENELAPLRVLAASNAAGINKAERFSRRNNIRLVGYPEAADQQHEQCIEIAEDIVHGKFEIDLKVERAHRDGRRTERPRHILIKLQSYRHKVDIMRKARSTLANEAFFFTDDLTKDDLMEKRRWSAEVKKLYAQGVKLRFAAGKWRDGSGVPFDFRV